MVYSGRKQDRLFQSQTVWKIPGCSPSYGPTIDRHSVNDETYPSSLIFRGMWREWFIQLTQFSWGLLWCVRAPGEARGIMVAARGHLNWRAGPGKAADWKTTGYWRTSAIHEMKWRTAAQDEASTWVCQARTVLQGWEAPIPGCSPWWGHQV